LEKVWKAIPRAINDLSKKKQNFSEKDIKELENLFRLTFGS